MHDNEVILLVSILINFPIKLVKYCSQYNYFKLASAYISDYWAPQIINQSKHRNYK